ncbi:Zn-dependent M28 family amino/carboxypeptidase [Microbacterium sp. BE35]|uniref:M20/M25/M40 family metallo-hydrolase n=1 Tax=Microbacterium sp. BE35 TaxID=2817773 RepID=UPI002865C38B|nr:M20/M25/M40 family metallo-hydrolase [Microbacterium sp. BE35]MDR7189212.1 Zn-dependent M28 family amino/carboxypeptidase [Microbacterium sp. BE35]
MPMRTRRAWVVATATALVATVALASPAYAAPNNNSVKKITKAVTLDAVLDHLEAFQDIADQYGDRAAGRPGYKASVDYVVSQLTAAGYTPQVQPFEFDYVEENSELIRVSPNPTAFVDESDFLRNNFDSGSPKGTATGPLVPVGVVYPSAALPPNSNTSGCESTDFAGFPAGGIALVQRGTCGFAVKVLNAQAAGAAGVIVMNEGQPGRTGLVGMIGDATGLNIPAVFATSATGANLLSSANSIVTVTVDYEADTRTAWNVLAETTAGNDANTVMAGAHLDSVQDGPGINDNGSGSAALLETAIQMQKTKPNNTVRFAWWGAEESGLLGSEHYVGALSEEQAGDIALYLNFDMIGSPNYFMGVYDGDNSSGTAAPGFIPEGSAQIEDVFEHYYTSVGEPFQDTEFSGRSDYGPFIAVGIPAGGLFTGAEGVKSAQQAAIFGGTAGVAFDSCYHAPCDDIDNLNAHALDVNSDAVAAAIMTFAFDTSSVNGVRAPGKSHGAGKSMDAFTDDATQ